MSLLEALPAPPPKIIPVPVFRSSPSSSSTPSLLQPARQPARSLARPLAEGVRHGSGWGLGCLPFYCFGEDDFFLLLLSVILILTLLLVTDPPPPLLSLLVERTANPQQHIKERERERGGAQPQFEVSSLSPQPVLLLLFTLLLGIFLSAHLLCRRLAFGSPEGASLSVWLSLSFPSSSSFSLSIWLCCEERLCMCVTADQRGCGYQRLPAAAPIPWAVPAKRRR